MTAQVRQYGFDNSTYGRSCPGSLFVDFAVSAKRISGNFVGLYLCAAMP
jgi:hypothetical protein